MIVDQPEHQLVIQGHSQAPYRPSRGQTLLTGGAFTGQKSSSVLSKSFRWCADKRPPGSQTVEKTELAECRWCSGGVVRLVSEEQSLENRWRSRTEPCGTPALRLRGSDITLQVRLILFASWNVIVKWSNSSKAP